MTWEVEEVRSQEICPCSCHSKQTDFASELIFWDSSRYHFYFPSLICSPTHWLLVAWCISFELPHQRGSGSDGEAAGIHMLTHCSLLYVSSLVSSEPLPQGKNLWSFHLLQPSLLNRSFPTVYSETLVPKDAGTVECAASKVCKTSLHNGLLK